MKFDDYYESEYNPKRLKYIKIIVLILFGAILSHLLRPYIFKKTIENKSSVDAQTILEKKLDGLPEYERAVIEATQKAIPAVVSILTYGTQDVVYRFRDPFLDMLWGGRVGGRRPISATGSGVIVDPNGTIITNDHVIGISRDTRVKWQVTLPDGRRFDAKLVKRFPMQDIAILTIDGKGLPYMKFGSSADVIQGQTALAIGNPFGHAFSEGSPVSEPTVTRGIISAKRRSMKFDAQGVSRYYRNMLQTDASINEGNSGGALIDIHGNLIGINTAIYTAGGTGSIGIGFAIPSDRIKLILERVEQYGDIGTPYIGINVEEMTQAMKEALDIEEHSGIIITTVEDGSPGEKSGFKRGDVIIRINGLDVSSVEDARKTFRGAIPGEIYTLTIFRDGKIYEQSLTLGSQ
ncbi:MAG: trypsin-like peptidase domain-containing protein [Candidatus Latescibacteria bacterium]|nr:trypsin-like peptidase domain-containing protein [Candidatus Latescibacterota bacterium]